MIYHIGSSVAAMQGLPSFAGGYGASAKEIQDFLDKIKAAPYRYLVAVTANQYQAKTGQILEKNGFKSIINFMSSHNTPGETMTLWYKYNKNKKLTDDAPIKQPNSNCTVTWKEHVPGKRFNLITFKGKKYKPGWLGDYKRLDKTPIYYKVDGDKNVIKGIFD